MGTRTADHLDAIAHLPDGATLVIHQVTWDEYEGLLDDLSERPNLRVSYDRGRLEIMSPTPEHEKYARFIDSVVRALADRLTLNVEMVGSATGKRRALGLLDTVDGTDVRVIQCRQHPRFAIEPGAPLSVRGENGGQDLDRDVAGEGRIVRAIDLAL